MLRQDSASDINHRPGTSFPPEQFDPGTLDIQQELSRLEEMILESPGIPLSGRTLVDEEQLLEQLERIQLSLPNAFRQAEEIVQQRQAIRTQAEQYAQDAVEQARRRAAEILDQTGIIQHAEREAQQIRAQLHQDCEAAKAQTIAELEQLHHQARLEIEEMRRQAIAECEELQRGADFYADRVLKDLEQQLGEMMRQLGEMSRVVHNGRQRLQGEAPRNRDNRENGAVPAENRPAANGRPKARLAEQRPKG